MSVLVAIDNCVIDLLAEAGANPAHDLRGTEFTLIYTPDLKCEYENALEHTSTSDAGKRVIREILDEGTLYGFFGLDGGPCLGLDRGVLIGRDQYKAIESVKVNENRKGLPRKRTDAHLVALAKNAVVMTNNTKEGLWRHVPEGDGLVIWWLDFREHWVRERNVASALRAHIRSHS